MKSIRKNMVTILAIFVAFVLIVPWGLNYLKDAIPGMPDWNFPSLGDLFESKKLPPEAKIGEIRFIEFSPTTLTPDVYVRGEVGEIEYSRKTQKRLEFDPTSRARIRDGQTISIDTLVGYDATDGKTPYYTRVDGDSVTLTIDPNALMAIQPRDIPSVNDDKIVCDDNRWKRSALDEGDCDSLVEGIPNIALVGFRSCLGTTWITIAKAIEDAERYRLEVLYQHFKRLEPKTNWQKPTLKVVFSPAVPTNWSNLPAGWSKSTKDGRNVLRHQFKDGDKTTTATVFTDRLKCTVDEGALKAELYREAEKLPNGGV